MSGNNIYLKGSEILFFLSVKDKNRYEFIMPRIKISTTNIQFFSLSTYFHPFPQFSSVSVNTSVLVMWYSSDVGIFNLSRPRYFHSFRHFQSILLFSFCGIVPMGIFLTFHDQPISTVFVIFSQLVCISYLVLFRWGYF